MMNATTMKTKAARNMMLRVTEVIITGRMKPLTSPGVRMAVPVFVKDFSK